MAQTPRLIDGIVLTKFDTIDDKVNMNDTGGLGGQGVAIFHKVAEAALAHSFLLLGV